MVNLEFSVFSHGEGTIAALRQILDQFEQAERVKVNLNVLPWQGGWARMVNVALYGEGFDVSEIGSTWVGDFVKMDALNPFSPAELRLIGGEADFLPAGWSSGVTQISDGQKMVWAIPWSADTRVIYYWRDRLEKAGIDEETAFQSVEALEKTLQTLQQTGVKVPLSLPMGRSRQNVHNLASFVWGAGGTFLSQDGMSIAFDRPDAITGMKNYFKLAKYLAPEVQHLGEGASEEYFTSGHAAVTISGTWVPTQGLTGIGIEKAGVTLVPGVPWVGGSNFIIWKNCRYRREAVRLIQYLSNGPLSQMVYPSVGMPARLSELNTALYTTDPYWKVMREALLKGQAFPTQQLWGLIESRLTDLLPQIWERIFAEPETALDTILDQYIPPLVRRLSMTLTIRT